MSKKPQQPLTKASLLRPKLLSKVSFRISSVNGASASNGGYVVLSLEDEESGITFAEVKCTPAQLGNAMLGKSSGACEASVRGGPALGKRKVVKHAKLRVSLKEFRAAVGKDKQFLSREALSEYLVMRAQKPGWILDPHLGSQNSISWEGPKSSVALLTFAYIRYEDPKS